MAITDELREWFDRYTMRKDVYDELTAIADRIDAEHEKAIASVMNDALYHANDKDMADLGWVRLPKDADGEYVHIGDVMVYADGNTCPMKAVALVPPAVFLTEDGPRYADMCRHKPPTVEDLLRQFLGECEHASMLGYTDMPQDIFDTYTAKLQLRDDAE